MTIRITNKNKVITNKLQLYKVNTGIYSGFESTGAVTNGKVVYRAEIIDVKKHICTLDKENMYAIDVQTSEKYKILKRDEYNRIVQENSPKLDERYVISMEEFKPLDKPKRLCLKNICKKIIKK